MLYYGMDAFLRILGIAAATVGLLTAGTVGARFFNTAAVRTNTRTPASFTTIPAASDTRIAMPLPPSSQRIYAFRDKGDPDALMAMYATPRLSPEQIAEFYLDEMPLYGWEEAEAREQQLNKHVEEIMLFFRKTDSECVICVGSEEAGAAWTIMLRPVIIGGRT